MIYFGDSHCGGAGFFGSEVVKYILTVTQHFFVNEDAPTYAGNLSSLASFESEERYEFNQVDICNCAELDRVFLKHNPVFDSRELR